MAFIDSLGKPGVMLDTLPFLSDSQAAAQAVGLPDLPVVALSVPTTAGKPEAELESVARQAQQPLIDALTKAPAKVAVSQAEQKEPKRAAILEFKGKNLDEATENMEKFFLANKMSDGLPLVPPTVERVNAMIQASGLPPAQAIGVLDPRKGMATVERLAINAVMAGCRPAYMPLLVAVAQAMADPNYDMHGTMVTTGLNAPLIIVSGPIIKELNLNFSYSTMGPGWKSNSSIGRASRLFIINIAQAWPGVNDMKDVGNPAKFGVVMAENEAQTPQGWGTFRERQGFPKDVSTVSLYASQSYRQVHDSQKYLVPTIPYQQIVDPMIARLMGTLLNSTVEQWGQDIVIDFSPVMAGNLAKMGYTPEKIQKELWEAGRIPRRLFGPPPPGKHGSGPRGADLDRRGSRRSHDPGGAQARGHPYRGRRGNRRWREHGHRPLGVRQLQSRDQEDRTAAQLAQSRKGPRRLGDPDRGQVAWFIAGSVMARAGTSRPGPHLCFPGADMRVVIEHRWQSVGSRA